MGLYLQSNSARTSQMKKPELPSNENERLRVLHSLNILDTPFEERFDRLTRLAQHMFNVPIALVSIIDENRQWFKSCVGLDVRETPRDISFCGHAILGNELFVIQDALQDERFQDNPLVAGEPHIRFYAGAPLRFDDYNLGTLCIIDREPRELTEADVRALNDLSAMAVAEIRALRLATIDELTGISNRRGFEQLARVALDVCYRKNIPASLLFIDLNQFKSINDTYGHHIGDSVLQDFAGILSDTFRKSDVTARLGGDEFAVLLTGAGEDFVGVILERLQDAVKNYNQDRGDGHPKISYSVGIIHVDHNSQDSLEVLMRKADSLMYEKKTGQKIGLAVPWLYCNFR